MSPRYVTANNVLELLANQLPLTFSALLRVLDLAKSPGREVLRALGAEETQQIGAEGSSVFSAGGDRIGVITEEKEATNGGTRAAESVFAASAQEDDKFHPGG